MALRSEERGVSGSICIMLFQVPPERIILTLRSANREKYHPRTTNRLVVCQNVDCQNLSNHERTVNHGIIQM